MTDLPEWAKIEALKRGYPKSPIYNIKILATTDWHLQDRFAQALAEMIYKHEKPPVSRELLIWREANALQCEKLGSYDAAGLYREGAYDVSALRDTCDVAIAIRLTLDGFGLEERK